MKNINKYIVAVIIGVIALFSCEKADIMVFDGLNNAVKFPTKNSNETQYTYTFSFFSIPNETSAVISVPVKLMGLTEPRERKVNVQIIAEGSTAPASEYQIIGGSVPADSMSGTVKIRVTNAPDLTTLERVLFLKIVESEDLKVGAIEETKAKVVWHNKLTALTGSQLTRFRYTFCNTYSTRAYRLALAVTRLEPGKLPVQGSAVAIAYGLKFRDSVNHWNALHPDNILVHDDGTKAGTPIIPYQK